MNLIFLLLENFTHSDRTPPYIDTYLELISKLWKLWKKHSPIKMSLNRRKAYMLVELTKWHISVVPHVSSASTCRK